MDINDWILVLFLGIGTGIAIFLYFKSQLESFLNSIADFFHGIGGEPTL